MRQRIFEDKHGNLCGEYPHDPAVGFVSGKRGLRRRLVPVDEREALPEHKAMELALKRYALTEHEIRDIQSANDAKKRAEEYALKHLTFSVASRRWLDQINNSHSDRTVKIYGQTMRLYLELVGDHRLREFGRSHNVAFSDALAKLPSTRTPEKPISVSTQHMHLRHLANFLRWSYDNELMEKQINIKKPKLPEQEMEVFSLEQLQQLKSFLTDKIDHAEPGRDLINAKNLMRAFMLATNCLLRVGAIAHLPLTNIDLDGALVKIRDVPERNWKNKACKWPNKPINSQLLAFLQSDLNGRGKRERWYLDDGNGRPWLADHSHVSTHMTKACREAGLPGGVKPFHWGMRAAMITWLLNNGVSPQKVQQLADHADIQTTMRYYNTRTAQQRDAVEMLPVI
ncbi:tyrosine-type recombinase/integrase [Oceanobacter mangrovi]|uniref:tyrosine-type recombinase/integrase n=1 Tax=Oceanobacter mangrovi TaxID=2862510 RepID=UPI001C8D6C4D|nr:site-specific integrase [Oceanobacter mangrovi]